MDREIRLASRADVGQILRPHLAPIAAIAIAADEASLALTRAVLDRERRPSYQPKTRGQLTAALWTEGVREWVHHVRPPGLAVYYPFSWTELIVHNCLHVRIQKERPRPNTPRRRTRATQFPDTGVQQTFSLNMANVNITNVDINTVYSEATGAIRGVRICAPLTPGELWSPINLDMVPARRQLESWRRRQGRVPWLEVPEQLQRAATYRELEARLWALEAELAARPTAVQPLPLAPEQPRPTFRAKKRRQDGQEGRA